MALVFIPVYVRLMGIESYGLVGVYASLVALISILDMGLSSTLSRELARITANSTPGAAQESRDLLRTLEVIYWAVGVAIGIVLGAGAPLLARYWLTASRIPADSVARAVAIMGLVIAVQWPSSLYDGGLTGLQRQVTLNGLRAAMATMQHGGAVLVLWLVSPTIVAYFTWQILACVAYTLVLRHYAWRALPASPAAGTFRAALLRRLWWFAGGMTGISVLTIVLTQTDKIILSRLLPLGQFGYYVVASNVATVIVYLVTPFHFALFPRFTELFAAPSEEVNLATLFHFSCQCVAVVVLPAAAMLVFFPQELLLLWMRDPEVARNAAPIARLLVIGQSLNALLFIPSLVQLAWGWTRLIFFSNVGNVIVLVPLTTMLVLRYGALGGAAANIVLNSSYFFVMIPLLHRRLLTHESAEWYRSDVAFPIAAVTATAAAARTLMPADCSTAFTFLWICAAGALAMAAAALAMPHTRAWVRRSVARGVSA